MDAAAQSLRFVRDTLIEAAYQVTATGAQEALKLMDQELHRLAPLDLVLPETDGVELMRVILGIADVPMIFQSCYGQDRVITRSFEMWADDYIVKPSSPAELATRVQAALRRRPCPVRMALLEPYVWGDLTIDYVQRLEGVVGWPVRLTAFEYELLRELSIHATRVLTHQHLLQLVWARPSRQRSGRFAPT